MAKIEVFNLSPVDYAGAGYVGVPGNREFFIQGTKDGISKSVHLEKQQLEHISLQAIKFLDLISNDFGQEKIATPANFDDALLREPLETFFRAHTMSIIFDEHNMLLTLAFRESDIDVESFDEQTLVNTEHIVFTDAIVEDKILRLTMTRTQLRALAVQGSLAVGKGREICELCLMPKNIDGHICPRMN